MSDEYQHEETQQHSGGSGKLWIFIICFFILFLLVLFLGWLPRHRANERTQKLADEQKNAKPVVQTEKIQASGSGGALQVPGTTIPDNVAYVYARANGYLKRYYVDIGQHVTQGQLLAVIDAPDLDAQVAQAREQLSQSEQQLVQEQSQLRLAKVTNDRYQVLVQKGVFSRQQGDNQETTFSSQQANVAAAERNVQAFKANLNRVISLQSYEQVRAPFAGVITQRNVDTGALISAGSSGNAATSAPSPGQISNNGGSASAGITNNAGSSGGTATAATSAQSPGQGGPLFAVSQLKTLRVLVSVPEAYAAYVHPGQIAPITIGEMPDEKLTAQVVRTANSIDPNTRTMLTELVMDNNAGKLIAGMYLNVNFPPQNGITPITVSDDAIAIRKDKPSLATVVDGKVHFVQVRLGRDFGNRSEVMTGLKAGDVVITQVDDNVVEGAPVQVKPEKKPGEDQKQNPKDNGAGAKTQ
jgi:multidrug efflux pump subunit AcrA (membrane-fusion protein)